MRRLLACSMMKPKRDSGSRPRPSAKRNAPGRPAWRAVTAIAVGAAAVGLLVWKLSESEGSPDRGKPGVALAGSATALPEPEQERALRTEQLQAADKLLAEFPDNDD